MSLSGFISNCHSLSLSTRYSNLLGSLQKQFCRSDLVERGREGGVNPEFLLFREKMLHPFLL